MAAVVKGFRRHAAQVLSGDAATRETKVQARARAANASEDCWAAFRQYHAGTVLGMIANGVGAPK